MLGFFSLVKESQQSRESVREKGEGGIKKVLVLILLMLSIVLVSLLLARWPI